MSKKTSVCWINSKEKFPEEYKFVFIYYKNDEGKWTMDIDYVVDREWEHHRYHSPIYWEYRTYQVP